MALKVTFLGTGTSQGVPLIACTCPVCLSTDPLNKRLRSSIRLEVDDVTIVIDSGPDFRQQMLRSQTKNLDALIFTHEHKDHIAGMDDIRAFNYINKKAIDVYASAQVQTALRREYQYIFTDFKYPGIPEINLFEIANNQDFSVKGVLIKPIQVMHLKLPVLGFRVNDFTYITDANYISDLEKEKIKGSKVLVLNALRHQKHISHYTLSEAIDLVRELQIPEAYFTHISHQLGLHHEVDSELPEGMHLAYDGLTLELE
ncbi:MAG: MBL fold metallo-hydrolase [Bacteroidia bacterium]|nr:MBL fold metallo-hydrolase [Bacteroidia bacterium]